MRKLIKWIFRTDNTPCNINEKYSEYVSLKAQTLKGLSTLKGSLKCCSSLNLNIELRKAKAKGRKKLVRMIELELENRI